MPRLQRYFSVMVALLLLTTGVYAGSLQLQIQDNRLTLLARDCPLRDILNALEKHGVKITADPRFNPSITASLRNHDLQKGLDSILKPFSYLLIWKKAVAPSGSVLAEIRIFDRGEPAPPRPSERLAVARNPQDGSFYIKNTVMVRLKPNADIDQFQRLINKLGARIIGRHSGAGIWEIRLPENADALDWLQRIANFTGIDYVEPDYAFHSPSLYRYTGLENAAIRLDNPYISDGAAPIAVMDSGLNMEFGLDSVVLNSLDALAPDQSIQDMNGHGTHMGLIASGLIDPIGASDDEDPANPIIPIKLFDDKGWSSNAHVMRGVDFALANGARILSLSWKTQQRSEFLQEALDHARAQGAIIIAAAGNEPTGEPVYPAAYPSVTAVGALDPNGETWERSNFGDFVDLQAPGFAIFPNELRESEIRAGTSIATAYIANQIASYLRRHPDASNEEALNAIRQQSGN